MSSRRTAGDSSLTPPLRLAETRTLTDVAMPPVVAGDLVLVTRRHGTLDAFDEASGDRRWSTALGSATDLNHPHAGAPLVDAGLVHAQWGGEFVSLHLATGDVANRQPAPALDLWDGVLLDGCVVSLVEDLAAPEGGRLEAWDTAKGASRWSIPHVFDPVPIAGDGNLVVAAGPESISGYDIRDGGVRWTVALEAGALIGALVIASDGSVLAALTKEVVSIDGTTGDVRWRAAAEVVRAGTMAVTDDGEIHVLDLTRYRRLSVATGSVLFAHDLDRGALPAVRGSLGRVSVGRAHVFAADQRGPLVAIAQSTGAIDWTWEEARRRAASVAPVLSPRRLYALAADGTLQTFEEVE